MTHRFHCRCGKLAGEVDAAAVNRGICYCKDCQAFAYLLGAPERILDVRDGTDIVQTSPQALTFTAGREHLACVRLTPRGLMRWYASCCNTAIGNTLYAVSMAPLSQVAPVREVSMLFAPLSSADSQLVEHDRRARMFGAARIAAGVVAIALV